MRKKLKKLLRVDPLTFEIFSPIRSNQRFASRNNRITFHNNASNKLREKLRPVNYYLGLNQKILNKLMFRKQSLMLLKSYLEGLGFTFDLFTGETKIDGKIYKTIYSYILIPINKTQIKIIKQ
jgi:hypothetical protein